MLPVPLAVPSKFEDEDFPNVHKETHPLSESIELELHLRAFQSGLLCIVRWSLWVQLVCVRQMGLDRTHLLHQILDHVGLIKPSGLVQRSVAPSVTRFTTDPTSFHQKLADFQISFCSSQMQRYA